MSGWIRVKDVLPDPGQKVVFCSRYRKGEAPVLTLGWYRPSKDEDFPWRDGFGSGDGPSVTHWMKIEAPDESS